MDKQLRAVDALFTISPNISYDEWMRVGMAAQAAGIDLETFDLWCSDGRSYDKKSVLDLWRSYKAEKGITSGTLFHIAKQHGYTSRRDPMRKLPAPVSTDVDISGILNKLPQLSKADHPSEIWNRCIPANNDHPYIQRKEGLSDGLRILPIGDSLTLCGVPMAGSLVVPVYRADQTISTLQFIATGIAEDQLKAAGKPTKLNLAGFSLEGWFTVGTIVNGSKIYVCEGIGQAWACWKATGKASVVAFGWGRVLSVAQQIQALHTDLQVVLVPDKGKESDAAEFANQLGCKYVCMPADWENNSDVNDLALRDGFDVLDCLLDIERSAHSSEVVSNHPLAKFIEFDSEPKAPKWIIPGFIGHGVVIIAGAHGVGKTTALLPLSMVAAGLHAPNDPLAPKHWRHVVYIVEDIEQAQRILSGMVCFSDLPLSQDLVNERLHLVEACRLSPTGVAAVGATYKQLLTRVVDGIEILPLVVIDTKAAVLAMENENDNAEGSAAMATLKQGFEGLPTWIIGHVAKQDIYRADAATLTLRGGSSFEADANQVLYLVKEKDDTRYLVRGKTRFEAKWPDLKIDTYSAHTEAKDEFGSVEQVVMRWGIPKLADVPRHEQVAMAKEDARQAHQDALLDQILQVVDQAHQAGTPLNREGVKSKFKRNRNDIFDALNQLISELWLFEVDVPSAIRTNPNRRSFLIAFTDDERKAYRDDGVLPSEKVVVPPSWRKPEVAEEQTADKSKPRKSAR